MIEIKRKRGELGSQMMIFTFLFLLIIIGGAIVAGNYIFFGQRYDGRQAEADELNYKISECLQGNMVDLSNVGEFYSKCGLNRNVLDERIYMIRIGECKDRGCGNLNVLFTLGSNFEACFFTGKSEDYPKCSVTKIVKEGKEIQILTASKQFAVRSE